jgi:glycine cleavage system aminomethyltransferase T
VTALAFLTPESSSEAICARSPMERPAREAGARFERRGGWNVAVGYGEPDRDWARETVGFADRSHLPKLEVHAPIPDFRGGVAEQRDGAWWCPVTPSRMLVLGEPAGGVPEASAAVDVTCGLAAMSLIGPDAGELLARFCAIDVRDVATPVGGFRPGSVARTPGYVLREAEDRLLVIVGWALGEYLWRVVADAAEHLGGGPVAVDA